MAKFEVELSRKINTGTPAKGAVLFDASAEEYVKAVMLGDKKLQNENAPKAEKKEVRKWDPDLMVD